VELAVCTFFDRPGARWAIRCYVGDPVYFYEPGGKFLFDSGAPAYALLGNVS